MLAAEDKDWITPAHAIVDELEKLDGPWQGRFQEANRRRTKSDGVTIPKPQFTRSLKPVLDMTFPARASSGRSLLKYRRPQWTVAGVNFQGGHIMVTVRRRARLLTALIAAAVLALTLVNVSRAEAVSPYFELVGFNNQQGFVRVCASVGGASLENGAPVVSWDCAFAGEGHPEQLWVWRWGTHLVNSNSAKCLAIGDGSLEAGARAIQWTCNPDKADQTWERISAGAGKGWILRNAKSHHVLAISGGSTANGTWIVQWPYNGSWEQKWSELHI